MMFPDGSNAVDVTPAARGRGAVGATSMSDWPPRPGNSNTKACGSDPEPVQLAAVGPGLQFPVPPHAISPVDGLDAMFCTCRREGATPKEYEAAYHDARTGKFGSLS